MVWRWTSTALAASAGLALGGCDVEPRWLEVQRVEPATQAADGSTLLFLNQELTVHFSEPIDPASVTRESFRVVDDRGHAVPGTLDVGKRSVRFTPVPPVTPELDDGSYRPGARYRLEIPGMPTVYAVRSAAGRTLPRGIVRRFSVPDRAGALGVPTLFLPVDAGSQPMMLDLTAGFPLRLAEDTPVLDLHFTRPVLPSSVEPEAFPFLRVVAGRDEPEVLFPARVEVVPQRLPHARHFGCSVRLEFSPAARLVAGDLVYLTFADPESGLRDYRDRPLLPPDVPLQVRVDPGDRTFVGDLDVAALELEPTGRAPLGFEVKNGRIRPRARVEAGRGVHGDLVITEDTTIVVGRPFAFAGAPSAPVPPQLELLGLDVRPGAELRIVSAGPLVVRVCGDVRISGRLVLDAPHAVVPWPSGTHVDLPQLLRSAGAAVVAAGPIVVSGALSHIAPSDGESPCTLVSAAGVAAHGRLPRETVVALEPDARFDGFAEDARMLKTSLTPGLPEGVSLRAEAWTAWLPIPAPRADTIEVRIVEPRGDLELQLLLAPARAVASGAAFEELPLTAVPVRLPASTPLTAPRDSMFRLEMSADVRGRDLPSFGGFTVHDRR